MSSPALRLYDGYDDTSPELRTPVLELQEALAPYDPEIAADGRFGHGTERAVRAFQRSRGLPASGVVGAETWHALHDPCHEGAADRFATLYAPDDPTLLEELEVATRYARPIEAAAAEFGLWPSVIAGLGSRASRWGLSLMPEGPWGTSDFAPRPALLPQRASPLPPDGGFGRGLMRLDYDLHAFARIGAWRDAAANIRYACEVLSEARGLLRRRTVLHGQGLLRGALAAYSSGVGNVLRAVRAGIDLDFYSAGRDYGRDVLERAGFFQAHGWD